MSGNLLKSLRELDAAADELLQKSMNTPEDDSKDTGSKVEPAAEPTPDEIVKDSTSSDEEDKEKNSEIEKSENAEKLEEKADELEEQAEKQEEDEETAEKNEEVEDSLQKSLQNPTLEQAFEVSDFLAAVTEAVTGSLSVMGGQIKKSNTDTSEVLGVLTKSLRAISQSNQRAIEDNRATQQLCKSMLDKFEEINSKLDAIGAQPMMRKSVGNVSVMDRNLNKSIGESTGIESLSKSQVLSILNEELYKGNPIVAPTDIISYESGAPLRPEVQGLVQNKANK